MSDNQRSTTGLRERKKARTRAEIQRHALRLFREKGYEGTAVSQIAAAAEVSESTFFRYFPTKEAIIMWDEFDPLIIEIFREQPDDLSPIQALRAALREGLSRLSEAERSEVRERIALMLSIQPLRAVAADHLSGPMRLLIEAVAERAGRRPDDFAVRTLVGAAVGACMSVILTLIDDPNADVVRLIDEAMAYLEAGLPL